MKMLVLGLGLGALFGFTAIAMADASRAAVTTPSAHATLVDDQTSSSASSTDSNDSMSSDSSDVDAD